jgi:nucleoside-diphosphate-sugar epimerase
MKILGIGFCGYIGSRLYGHLKKEGHEITTVDLELRGNFVNPENHKRDYRRTMSCHGYDAVILLAGHSSVGACEVEPLEAFRNNLGGLVDLCGVLTQAGRPMLIYASSASVYSVRGGRYRNMYDLTKTVGDEAVRLLYGEHAWGLRFGTVCGASPNMRLDLMVNRMVHDALTRGVVSVRNPAVKRPILGMGDLCRGVSVILGGQMMPGVYNFASFNSTVGEIGFEVARLMGADVEELPPTPAYDFEMPGSFLPRDRLADIVAELREWYAKEGNRIPVAAVTA